jgi:hypothetical protein
MPWLYGILHIQSSNTLNQKLTNYDLKAKSGPLPGYVNKMLWEHSKDYSLTYCPGLISDQSNRAEWWTQTIWSSKNKMLLSNFVQKMLSSLGSRQLSPKCTVVWCSGSPTSTPFSVCLNPNHLLRSNTITPTLGKLPLKFPTRSQLLLSIFLITFSSSTKIYTYICRYIHI